MFRLLDITPLPLLKGIGDQLQQCIAITVEIDEVDSAAQLVLQVREGKLILETGFTSLRNGRQELEVFLPEAAAPATGTWMLQYGEESITRKVTRTPVRRWEIYLVLHSHTDLGFTAPVSEVAQIHNDNTDQAILFCRETSGWPEGSRFKWTCEVTWQVENYLRDRPAQKVDQLVSLIRSGRMDVGALYSGELTEILGHEQAVRSLYYAAYLQRRFGIPIETAMLCDVPGCTAGFVQMMARAGIRNFILADNNFIAPFLLRTDLPRPFFWQGADGSEVLAWYTDHPYFAYIEGKNYGFADSCRVLRRKLPLKLLALEKEGYAYPAFQIQYAFDNFRIEFRPAVIVREWNDSWAYPKIRLATASEFLKRMRADYAAKIPKIRGDWSNWWGGIVAYYPYETALSRLLHQRIPHDELMASLLRIHLADFQYPASAFERIYHQTLAFDEHTTGGKAWFSEDRAEVLQSVQEGYGFIHHANSQLREIENTLFYLDLRQHPGIAVGSDIAVFNPSSWPQSGIVHLRISGLPANTAVIDLSSGIPQAVSPINDDRLCFQAQHVPALGFKKYRLVESVSVAAPMDARVEKKADKIILSNKFYRIEVIEQSGEIQSLYSRQLDRELCRGGELTLNRFIAHRPEKTFESALGKFIPEIYNGTPVSGELLPLPDQSTVRIEIECDGVRGAGCIVHHELFGQEWLRQEIRLGHAERHAQFRNTFFRRNVDVAALREAMAPLFQRGVRLYFAFPFDLPGCRFRCEATAAVFEPAIDQFKGACRDHFAVQDWCQLSNDRAAINFFTPDAPLVEVGEISAQKYREELPADLSALFVRFLALGEWGGADESPFSKNEDLVCRFAVSAHDPQEQILQNESAALLPAFRLGEALRQELIPIRIDEPNRPIFSGEVGQFCRIEPGNLQVLVFKQAESGDGYILRLREIVGCAAAAKVSFPGLEIKAVQRTTITERPLERLEILRNRIEFDVSPFAIETIMIKFSKFGIQDQ